MVLDECFKMKKVNINKSSIAFVLCLWVTTVLGQVEFHFEEYRASKIRVVFRDSSYYSTLDNNGKGEITFSPVLNPGYAVLYGPKNIMYFYLIPTGKQSLLKYKNGDLKFLGAGKAINEYLNGELLELLTLNYNQPENEFLSDWNKMFHNLQINIDSLSLNEEFKKVERKRLHYLACNMLQNYPLHRARFLKQKYYLPHSAFYQQQEKIMIEDSEAYDLWEYRQAFRNYIQALASKNINNNPLSELRYALNYTKKSIKDSNLQDYLIHTFMYGYVRKYGVKDIHEFLPIYNDHVHNIKRKADFKEIYQKFSRITQGKQAPYFILPNAEGEKISISMLRGKYIYIDVWATWCLPCCRELPYLFKLQEMYKGKPINFVSISIDEDESKWKGKIKTDNLQGVQLRADRNNNFQKDYQISRIPRFILIDAEGKIIDENMTRPSDPKTINRIDSLFSN